MTTITPQSNHDCPTAKSELPVLRLGARGSLLSRMQSTAIAEILRERHAGLRVQLQVVQTSGDKLKDQPLHAFGGKGLFTKELEQALLAGTVDFAVHSFKDVPVTMPLVDVQDLVIAAVPVREDPRDVLVSERARRLEDLPHGARVGTGSLRRQAQLLALRPDLEVTLLRGNVDTRLRKLRTGQYDAIILAAAGLRRCGLFDEHFMAPIPVAQMVPSAAQGALALQCRRNDDRTLGLLGVLNDPTAALCVELERTIVARLNGDCHSPIAAYATVENQRVHLVVAVGQRAGRPPVIHAASEAAVSAAQSVIEPVIESLMTQGAKQLLSGN